MTEMPDSNNIFNNLQKKLSLNTILIRTILSILTVLFFSFAPIVISPSQSKFLIINAGIGFLGNIIAYYFLKNNRKDLGFFLSIFSFNFAYLGISITYDNLGALTYLLVVIPSTLLIFSYIENKNKIPFFISINIIALLAVLFDYFFHGSNFRIYLNQNILQLIYTLYLVLIIFISIVYLMNYFRLFKFFSIEDRILSNQTILLTTGVSIILLLVFITNYFSALSSNQDKITASIEQISNTIQNFFDSESASIKKTSNLSFFSKYIEDEFLNNLTNDEQNIIESNLNLIKSEVGLEGNNFVAAVLNRNGELLAISDSDKLNFFKPENFYNPDMKTAPYITNLQFSSNSNFSYIYFTHPIQNRYSSSKSNGILVYALNYTIFEKLINSVAFFNDSNNYAILMDQDFIQLYNGKNNDYSFTLPLNNISQERIDELIKNKKLPQNFNKEFYPYNENFSNILLSFDNELRFNPTYEGDNQNTEMYMGLERISFIDKQFYIASLIPYSNIHAQINQSILIYFILGTILLSIYVLISQSNTISISQGIKDINNSLKSFIKTNKIIPSNYLIYDDIYELNKNISNIQEKFEKSLNDNEEILYSETSKLNQKILSLKNASSISVDISYLSNTNKMLNLAVELINEKFNFYHTCIFMYKDDYLQYFTGSGQEGLILRESNYKIDVLAEIPICEAIRKDFSVAGSIYGKFLSHPLLQDSKDELAIPIKIFDKLVGVLNIHSYKKNSFFADDYFIFQNIANQLAIYINKNDIINSLTQTNQDLKNALFQENDYLWKKYQKTNNFPKGYKYNLFSIEELQNDNELCRLAWELKKVVISNQFQSLKNIYPNSVAIPIFENEIIINVFSVTFDSNEELEKNLPLLIKLSKEIGNRLDKLRIVDQYKDHINRQKIIDSIIEDIFISANLDDILSTVTKSIGEKLNISQVDIHINDKAENDFGETNAK